MPYYSHAIYNIDPGPLGDEKKKPWPITQYTGHGAPSKDYPLYPKVGSTYYDITNATVYVCMAIPSSQQAWLQGSEWPIWARQGDPNKIMVTPPPHVVDWAAEHKKNQEYLAIDNGGAVKGNVLSITGIELKLVKKGPPSALAFPSAQSESPNPIITTKRRIEFE